jgi:predicted RNase H-like HicB family nuclease
MGALLYHVHADWDPEVSVWVATSDDVPGLATEAPTLEALAEKLRILISELLQANSLLPSEQRRLQSSARPTLKELLLAEEPRAEIPAPPRHRWRRRTPAEIE